jgi:CheY-like chemotaxis protein
MRSSIENIRESSRTNVTTELPYGTEREQSIFSTSGPPRDDPNEYAPDTSGDSSVLARKLKILIADDEQLVALTLTEILEEDGFEVLMVHDGTAAVQAARTMQPDLVLTDVMMPKMNGIEAAKSIKSFLPKCRIILISGQAATGDLLKQAQAEGHDFEIVTKPIRPDALLALLRRRGE